MVKWRVSLFALAITRMIKRRVSSFALLSGILTASIAFVLLHTFVLFQSDHLRVADHSQIAYSQGNTSLLSMSLGVALAKKKWSVPATKTTKSSSSTTITSTIPTPRIGNYYSDPLQAQKGLERHFQRGLNFLTCYSPCRMASWVFNGGRFRLVHKEDCFQAGTPAVKLLNVSAQMSNLKPKDTIYVPFFKLDDFVSDILRHLPVDVILMSGQQQITPSPLDPLLMKQILDHPHVLHWFIHNLEMFGGEYRSHPKMSPLPFGLKQGGIHNVNTAVDYRKVFVQHYQLNKTELLYMGYLAKTSDSRQNIAAAKERAPMSEYLDGLARAQYILSPSGMKPECYRHYEAIGLGTIPVTEMNQSFAWHLQGSVIFGTTNWDVDVLKKELPQRRDVSANRNMIFEEYWMEYMEAEVKKGPLNWWDRHANRRAMLQDFITVELSDPSSDVSSSSDEEEEER